MSELTPGQIQEIATIVDKVVSARMGNRVNDKLSDAKDPMRLDVGVGNMLGSLNKMALGVYDTSEALADFDKVVKGILPAFPGRDVFAELIKNVGNTGLAMNRSMMDSAKSGFTFYQNLGLYDTMILSARMNLKEWNNLVRDSGTQLTGLSSDANKSGLMFLSVAKQLQEDPETRKAIIAGVGSIEEYNNALRMVSQATKFQNLSESQTRKDMAESAKGLVFELDMMAKLTGKSREKMAKDIEEQNATAQMRLRIASMTKEEQDAYLKNQVVIQGLPKAAQELLTAYQTGGLRNARDRENAAAFTGTNIEGIIKQVSEIKTNTPEADEQRRTLLAQMQQELVAVGANKDRLREMSVLAATDNATAQKIGQTWADLADSSALALKQQKEAADKGQNLDVYVKNLYDAAISKIRRVGLTPVTPEEQGAAASQAINAVETSIKDLQIGAAVQYIDTLNTSAGKLATNFEGMEVATKPFTTEMFKNIGPNLKSLMDSFGYTAEKITPKDKDNPALHRHRDSSLNQYLPANHPDQPIKQANGSKDTFGDWFTKDWGMGGLSELHGKEAVVPQEKIGEFLKDMIAKTPSLLSDLQGNLKSTLSEAKASMPTTDTFKDMFNNIKFPEMPSTTEGTGTASNNSFATTSQNNDVMTELAKGMNQLNMRVERLIAAVEDGADKNVRATKTKGNVLA